MPIYTYHFSYMVSSENSNTFFNDGIAELKEEIVDSQSHERFKKSLLATFKNKNSLIGVNITILNFNLLKVKKDA